MKYQILSAALAMLVAVQGSLAPAEDKNPAVTDAEQGGIEFKIQGEYSGEINAGDTGKLKVGVQVIALGKGMFNTVAHIGGLPGDGWNGQDKHEKTGELKDGAVTIVGDQVTATIKDGKLSIRSNNGQDLGTLEKVERKSSTLGAKAPEGAVVLFDGKSPDNFSNGKITKDGLLMVGVKSKKAFKNFSMHMEFRLPFMPEARGQGRANSGLYLQDRYELQILDSFGLKGLNNECGGFYQQRDPNVNMCYPPLAWQTYDIDFTAAKFEGDKKVKNATVTVRHNGAIIHENFEFSGPSPGGQAENDQPGVLQLQDHGNPVHFRNIWVVEK